MAAGQLEITCGVASGPACRRPVRLPCQCRPHPGVGLLRRVRLHVRRDVRIDIERDPDVGVPETLLRHLGMHPQTHEHRRMGVPLAVGDALQESGRSANERGVPPRHLVPLSDTPASLFTLKGALGGTQRRLLAEQFQLLHDGRRRFEPDAVHR